jgi:hypothetical protein
MAELTATDLEEFTGGRIPDDDTTATLLGAALAGLRRYCGWHVTPVVTGHVVRLDGPGAAVLTLPTLQLADLTALTENGEDVLAEAVWVPAVDGQAKRAQVGRTSCYWPQGLGAISATMTHGFTEEDAADWRLAAMKAVERMSAGGRDDPALLRKKVVEVEYQWSDSSAGGEWGGVWDEYCIDRYRLMPEI